MDVLIWPAVVVILVVFFCIFFKSQIAGVLNRTKKIAKLGLETYEPQPPPPKEEKKELMEFYRSFESPLIKEWESAVNEFIKLKKIEVPDDREKALLRLSAQTGLLLFFEHLYGKIYTSQVVCLRYLNPKTTGADISELKPIYEMAKNNFPAIYQNYPIETWIDFLKGFNLIKAENSKLFISIVGQEFLKYLAGARKSELIYG